MARPLLDPLRVDPAIRDKLGSQHADIVQEVEAACAAHPLVMVGMGINPFVLKARQLLDTAGMPYHYLGYGSYFSLWRRRLALKLWSGWSTFPMVFVKGTLIGGLKELKKLHASGELQRRLG